VNKTLPDRLEILSTDPYGEGWIAKIRVSDETNLSKLLDHKAYQKQCEEEGH
ncbi:MAG: glycine cleavage system protein H, partial [Pirellulales bacterium]|nr:glycine cleavage system protein H [Pirellulales bacterium]